MEVIDIKDPTNKKEFIELLDVAIKYAHGLLALFEEMGKNLEVNAIAEAKAEISGLERFYRKPDGSIVFNAIPSVGADHAFNCSHLG